jgi:hypothetical protein
MKAIFDRLRCRLGFHDLKKDSGPVNGVWWAFCRRCGARHAGEYDPATGETTWKYR